MLYRFYKLVEVSKCCQNIFDISVSSSITGVHVRGNIFTDTLREFFTNVCFFSTRHVSHKVVTAFHKKLAIFT